MSEPNRKLPSEILKIIFLNLSKEDADDTISKKALSQCALTCSSWKLVAQSIIFNNIVLKNEKDIEDLSRMTLHNYMIEQWTRCLCIHFIVSKPSTLIAIDKLLPRIEDLSFSPVDYSIGKSERQKNDPAYSFLYKLLAKDNKFNNLRVLPVPETIEQDKLYVGCLYVIRNNITDMKIYDVDNENRLLYANLCNNLHLFPHLKSVCAVVPNNKLPLDVLEYCESLLTKKNLSSIFLQKFTIQIINSSYVNSSALLEQDNIFPASNIKSISISIDYYAGELQSLEELGDNLMIYITKKFPNLNFLELAFNYAEVLNFSRIERVPLLKNEGPNRIRQLPGVICQFLNYIYKIPNCYLQDLIVSKKEYTVQILRELFKEDIKNSVPILPNYNNCWEEEPSCVTLDAEISPKYSKIDAYMYFYD